MNLRLQQTLLVAFVTLGVLGGNRAQANDTAPAAAISKRPSLCAQFGHLRRSEN